MEQFVKSFGKTVQMDDIRIEIEGENENVVESPQTPVGKKDDSLVQSNNSAMQFDEPPLVAASPKNENFNHNTIHVNEKTKVPQAKIDLADL